MIGVQDRFMEALKELADSEAALSNLMVERDYAGEITKIEVGVASYGRHP